MPGRPATPGNPMPVLPEDPHFDHAVKIATRFQAELELAREVCLWMPETSEVWAWGHPTFRGGKRMFAALGFEDDQTRATISFRVGSERQAQLLEDTRFRFPAYSGPRGWVSLLLDTKPSKRELRALAEEAYRGVALKRMLKALDDAP